MLINCQLKSEILIGIQTFLLNKIYLKMSSAKWHPFCLGLHVFNIISSSHVMRKHYFLSQWGSLKPITIFGHSSQLTDLPLDKMAAIF